MSQRIEVTALEDLKPLIGDLKDNSESQDRFRGFLQKEKWTFLNFKKWCDESIEKGYSKEFQDLITALGKRLSFDIEFGNYTASRGEIPFDGLWKRGDEILIVIETKLSDVYSHDVSQVGGYIEKLALERGVPRERIFGLYVVENVRMSALADQIRGNSSYRERVRMISCEDLLKLIKLQMDLKQIEGIEGLSEKIQSILLPMDNVDIGKLVNVITEIAEFKSASPSEREEAEGEGIERPEGGWSTRDLHAFLAESTEYQKTLFKILARTDKIARRRLIEEMKEETQDTEFDGFKLAGTRAGITMRTNREGKEQLIITSERGRTYELHSDYKSDISEYFSH